MHQPVLVKEVVDNLLTEDSRIIVDATVGSGGHAQAILQKLKAEGRLIGLDRDQSSLEIAKINLARYGNRIRFGHLRFSQINSFLSTLDIKEVSGFLFDLGFCSLQLDQSQRGFSYQSDGPLDMRMDRSQSKSAYEVINRYSFSELNQILFRFGQERFSKKIARTIVNRRNQNPISTTSELKDLVESVIRPPFGIKSLARVFQAIRIEVNDELNELAEGLKEAIRLLSPGGRLCTISYHSLEHGIIKNKLRSESKGCICPPRFPVCGCGAKATIRMITVKPIVPTPEEKESNPRSRSAKLWVAEKLRMANH